jgi:hypothetical protein
VEQEKEEGRSEESFNSSLIIVVRSMDLLAAWYSMYHRLAVIVGLEVAFFSCYCRVVLL